MKKILLVKQPYAFYNNHISNYAALPIRTAYLAAILEKHNIDYDILDLNIKSIEEFGVKKHNVLVNSVCYKNLPQYIRRREQDSIKYLLWIKKQVAKQADHTEFIGINGDNSLTVDILKAARAKNENIKCIIGGGVATRNPLSYIQMGLADYVCQGYADQSLPEIIKKKEKIPNVVTSIRGRIFFGKSDKKIIDILTPNYSRIKLNSYFKYFAYVPLVSVFGCNYGCPYCSWPQKSGLFIRKYDKIIEEIQNFKDNYSIENFTFIDNCVNNYQRQIHELCRTLIDSKTEIRWRAMFRAAHLNKESVQQIAHSGCTFASFGIETPVVRLQKAIGKNLNISDTKAIIRNFKANGIATRASFMYDLPSESLTDFYSCFRYIRQTGIDYYRLNKLFVYPNTMMYNKAEEYFPVVRYTDSVLQRIRSTKEIALNQLKTAVAETVNQLNDYRFNSDPRQNSFYYTSRYLKIMGRK